jgi:hypothetical protein
MYGTSKIKEEVEALFELVLPLYSHKGRNHEIRVLLKEAWVGLEMS